MSIRHKGQIISNTNTVEDIQINGVSIIDNNKVANIIQKGGWREVSTALERDAIPDDQLEVGMIVYVVTEAKAYLLTTLDTTVIPTLKTWEDYKPGQGDYIRKITTYPISSVAPLYDGEIVQYQGPIVPPYFPGYFFKDTQEYSYISSKSSNMGPASVRIIDLSKLETFIRQNQSVIPGGWSDIKIVFSNSIVGNVHATNGETEYQFGARNTQEQWANIGLEIYQSANYPQAGSVAYIAPAHFWKQTNVQPETDLVWGNITGTLSNQTDLQEALDAKQDTLTAGTNITIEEDSQTGDLVISSVAQESFFRGRWANWSFAPSNGNEYPEDYHGNRKPTDNDFMVLSDASDYVNPSSLTHPFTVINIHSTAQFTIKFIDEYRVEHTYYYAPYQSDWVQINEHYSLRYVSGAPGRWYIRTNKPEDTHIVVDGIEYEVDPTGTTVSAGVLICQTDYSTTPIGGGLPSQVGQYQGAWRFVYHGDWDTNGKLGWTPQYQIENTLPIATDQEAGITKLYTDLGSNTDGTMDQNSITTELGQRVLQLSELPEATSENVGTIVQFIGTDPSYIIGYFYKVTPYSHSSSLESQVLGSVTVNSLNINTFESTVFPSGNYEDTTLVFIYNGSNWTLDGNVVTISDYGVSLYGTPTLSDKITLTYVAPSSGYEWIRTDVQPNPTTYESFFRGRYETWVSVPTNVNNYIPDFHGNTTPLKNDYMVVTDSSGYVNPDFTNDPENTTFIKTSASVYSLDIVVGSNRISTYYTDFTNVYKTIRELFEAKGVPGVGCTWLSIKYIPGSPGWWALKATNDYFLDNVPKTSSTETLFMNTSESAGTTHYTSKDAGVAPIPLSGGWRFRYTGEWNTDGKNGWKPEYQVEDVLPIASSTIQGIAKLYNTTGQNTDGSITQKLFTDTTNNKLDDVKIYGTSKVDRPTKTANLNVVEQCDQTTMPVPSQDLLGRIVQYIGPNGLVSGYVHGYFYECQYVTTPSSIDLNVIKQSGSQLSIVDCDKSILEFNQGTTTNSWTFISHGGWNEWYLDDVHIDLNDWGISYQGEPSEDDEIDLDYTEASSIYKWVAIPVQPDAEPITSAQIQALWSE